MHQREEYRRDRSLLLTDVAQGDIEDIVPVEEEEDLDGTERGGPHVFNLRDIERLWVDEECVRGRGGAPRGVMCVPNQQPKQFNQVSSLITGRWGLTISISAHANHH